MQLMQRMAAGHGTWVRRFEHLVLRLVALAFSLASAHAIRWFFAPLDGVDTMQPAITWTVAIGFGVLGYFVSRGLAHRMMNKERIRAYAPICILVELVEIFCNYALAAAVIQRAKWLSATPPAQHATLTALTAASIARAYSNYVQPELTVQRVVLGGGGESNRALVDMLRKFWPHDLETAMGRR